MYFDSLSLLFLTFEFTILFIFFEYSFRPTSIKTWGPHRHLDYSLRTFDARLGPPGGSKGYSGITGMPSNGFVWYINGYVASELYMRRGLTYAFRVEGGDDPYNPDFYNPLVISTDPVGGYERLSKEKDSRIRVLAGLEYTRRGVPRPTASGKDFQKIVSILEYITLSCVPIICPIVELSLFKLNVL